MGVRPRVVSSVLIGGLMTGAVVLGAPAAAALPNATGSCGGSVSAAPGDTIYGPGGVKLGTAGSSSGPVSGVLGLVSCTVNVTVKTASSAANGAASGVKSGTGAVGGAVGGAAGGLKGATDPSSSTGGTRPTTTASAAAPTSRSTAAAPTPAPAAVGSAGTATLADAPLSPAFAPMFAGLPASFLASAAPGASAISTGTYDAGLLLGGAPFRVALPTLLGEPTTAVTSASQLQALPIDGLGGGLGVPAVLAVLVAAGIAALGVRRAVLGRRVLPGRGDLARLLGHEGTAGS